MMELGSTAKDRIAGESVRVAKPGGFRNDAPGRQG